MKDFLKNQSKPLWKPSIFGEGLRQLRLLGIVYTAISVVMLLLIFLDYYDYGGDYQKQYFISGGISGGVDEVVIMLVISSTIFIVAASLYLMRFLRSAKARDFYCSTPNSVGTVWLNFAAAVYAWNLIGLLAAYVPLTLLMMIQDVKSFGMCLQMFVGNFTFSLMVFGFTMLAVILTGRLINAIASIIGFAFTPALLWAVYHAALIEYFTAFGFLRFPNGLTCPDPFGRLLEAFDMYYGFSTYSASQFDTPFDAFCSGGTIFYCLVMGILYFAAAFLFASIRTGDTAGRPFVNKAAHFIALMALVVPTVSIGTHMMTSILLRNGKLWGWRDTYLEETVFEIAFIIILVLGVCWLAELLYTFDIKHSHLSLKYLPIPVAVAALLAGIGYAQTAADMTTTVDSKDVESVTLVRNNYLDDSLAIFRLHDTYGRTVTEKSSFKDAETINYVTKQINDFVKLYQEDTKRAYSAVEEEDIYGSDYDYYYGEEESPVSDDDINYINIQLNLKNGKTVTRSIKFDKAHREQMAAAIESDKDYMKQFLTLPDADQLNISIGIDGNTIGAAEVTEIYKAFLKEYNALSDEEKFRYLKSNLYSDYDEYDYSYSEPVTVVVESEPVDEEKERSVVSESDVTADKLVSKSSKAGDYVIENSDFYITADGLGEHTFLLDIEGYADGHLYDEKYHFTQTLRFGTKTMPETHALTVKTCNAKIPETLKALEEAANDTKSAGWIQIRADYYGDKQETYVCYDQYSHTYERWYDNYTVDDYEDYYDEETDQYRQRKLETIEVDSNAMVAKLLSDAAATGESVDFTKPYCEVIVNIHRNRQTSTNNFFIQTEFEMIH